MFLNFIEAFTYMFKDKRFWDKYLLGMAFTMLTVLPLWVNYRSIMEGSNLGRNFLLSLVCMLLSVFCVGFGLIYANKKFTLNSNELPEWIGNFKSILTTGLKYFGGTLAFFFVSLLIIFPILLIIMLFLSIIAGIAIAPTIAQTSSSATVDPALESYMANVFIILFVVYYLICLPIFICWIGLFMLSITSFITNLKFSSFFNFKKMGSLLRGNVLNLVFIIGSMIVYTIISCFISLLSFNMHCALNILFGFYFTLVLYNLYAQYAKIGTKKFELRIAAKKKKEEELSAES